MFLKTYVYECVRVGVWEEKLLGAPGWSVASEVLWREWNVTFF